MPRKELRCVARTPGARHVCNQLEEHESHDRRQHPSGCSHGPLGTRNPTTGIPGGCYYHPFVLCIDDIPEAERPDSAASQPRRTVFNDFLSSYPYIVDTVTPPQANEQDSDDDDPDDPDDSDDDEDYNGDYDDSDDEPLEEEEDD